MEQTIMNTKNEPLDLVAMKNEINAQLGDKETFEALMRTTFKGLQPQVAKQAALEGVMRGFTLKDFLDKNVYAVPFREGYSLVTSIDYARKIGMRSGIVGKSAPQYEESEDGKVISCTITVKRKIGDYVGDYSATVSFSEYSTGKNLWATKPRTMIAKVAEMHALRAACPEELSKAFTEEEMEKETIVVPKEVDIDLHRSQLEAVRSIDELKTRWANLPVEAKEALKDLKEELKKKYENA